MISELRKGARADERVRKWFARLRDDEVFLSVLVMGELRRGVECVRRRDPAGAGSLEAWLQRIVADRADRILPITAGIADAWGRMNVPDPLPVIDSLLAATAHVHRLTVATRNTRDFARAGVTAVNPFAAPPATR